MLSLTASFTSQDTKVKQAASTKVEDYPEIEKFIPYDPLGNQTTDSAASSWLQKVFDGSKIPRYLVFYVLFVHFK